jgi:membrane-bound lytic murein transglycosylase MltF
MDYRKNDKIFLMKISCLKFLAVFIFLFLLSSCNMSGSDHARSTDPDSLLNFVKKRIEQKKQIEIFRKKTLPRDFEKKIENYYPVIRKYSKRYGFDWRLIVMQILKESRFREDARSHVGAMGLMQIMPSTASELHQEMDIEFIANNPRENIAAGIYHLYKQVSYFPEADRDNRVKLGLAAYNSGIGRIKDAQSVARYLKMNSQTWEAVKYCLPKLTAHDWRLHLEIWELGVPNYGYFYGFQETLDYVEEIIRNYQIFIQMYR